MGLNAKQKAKMPKHMSMRDALLVLDNRGHIKGDTATVHTEDHTYVGHVSPGFKYYFELAWSKALGGIWVSHDCIEIMEAEQMLRNLIRGK